jgi:hypothetical protein
VTLLFTSTELFPALSRLSEPELQAITKKAAIKNPKKDLIGLI